jgi:hypothetical protein
MSVSHGVCQKAHIKPESILWSNRIRLAMLKAARGKARKARSAMPAELIDFEEGRFHRLTPKGEVLRYIFWAKHGRYYC